MMRMHPSSLQLDEQDQDHVSSTTKESMATNIVTPEVAEEEEAVIVTAAAASASAVNTINVNVEEEVDHCYSDEEESLQVSDVELLMDNFSSALVSSILTMDSGYIEYVNDNEDNDNEDNAEDNNEDESELNKFEYHDCSTRNQDDQHILIRGYKLIDTMCCSIGSGAIEVPVNEEEEVEEKGNEGAHAVVVAVTEVTSIESELDEVLLVPPPTLVESTTVDEIATPLVDDADIAVAAAALNDAGGNDNNDAWFEQFSAGYEDLCCCVGTTNTTTSTTNTNTSSTTSTTSSATSITKNTPTNYVNNNGNDNININNNINNREGLIRYTEEEIPTTMTVIDNAVDPQLHKQQSMLSIGDDDDDNYDYDTNGKSVAVVLEPVAAVAEAVAEVLSDVQHGIVFSNTQLKKQPHSKEVDEKEKQEQEQEQVEEDNKGSEFILDDPRYNCNTNVPLSPASSSSCGAQTKKSSMSTKTPLNASKTKNSNMNDKRDDDDDDDDHGDYDEQQTVCTNGETVVTKGTNKSTKSITPTVTKVEKLKEHLRDMVRVRARAFPFKKTFSSSSFGNKSNNIHVPAIPSALAPTPELLSPTEEFAFKPKKSNKQMKKKDKNHVMLSTSSTKKMTNRASSKSFGRRKTSNAAVNKRRRPVLLSVTIEEEGHTEDIIAAPLLTKPAGANENEDDNEDEESTDVLSAIPKLIVPKKRKDKLSGVTDDKTSVSLLSSITENNKSIHTILRKEVNKYDQRDDDDTSVFPEKSSSIILNPYPVGGSGLGSGSGLSNSTFDSGVDDASSQLYSLCSSNDDKSIDQTEYRNKSKDYYIGDHSISDADYLKDIYTVKPMHSGKQVKAGQLTL